LTGDLGFMALEPLQQSMGARFINAGVAEQNMVSVAAAMAKLDLEVWAYSIAPFIFARPFEQIRNDVALHGLAVKLLGNGGGFGYGVMGPTHHAIDDYGPLLALPKMVVFAPVFDEDVAAVVAKAGNLDRPCYVRLGRGEPPKGFVAPSYEPWRQLIAGDGPVVVAVGPLAGCYIKASQQLPSAQRPNMWAAAEMPLDFARPPQQLLQQIQNCGHLIVAEEHVAQGGMASQLLLYLARNGLAVGKVDHLCAVAHQFDRYGSQAFLRTKSGLAEKDLLAILERA
jgi:transketolase